MYNKLSPEAKKINLWVATPIALIAFWLWWSGSPLMEWVSQLKEMILGESSSLRRERRQEMLVLILALAVPLTSSLFVYDFFAKKGIFSSSNENS